MQTGRHSAFGVFGYKTPKAGIPIKNPLISFTKDRCKNFLEHVQKRAKKTPGPPDYYKPFQWPPRNHSVKMKLDSKRTTFTDEVAKITKEIPASNHYNPKKSLPNVLLGKSRYLILTDINWFSKAEGVNYISDVEFLAKTNPAPT